MQEMPRPLPLEYVPLRMARDGTAAGLCADPDGVYARRCPPKTEATVIANGGTTGHLLENVNRWRGQVGAQPLTRLEGEPPALEVGGAKGMVFDIEGKSRMLMVMAKRNDETWYFKLMGKSDVVAKNKAAFETFIKSIKFNGGGR
jgi:hypothetical protein